MFEPTSYHEKRAALNEMLLQQLTNVVMRSADPQTRAQMQMMMEQYGRGGQLLRDSEVTRILGPVVKEEGADYIDAPMMLEFLKANVGRTYFGTEEQTSAPDGSIGTAGFGKKFKDWLAGLPAYDTSLNKDMLSGFYRDDMTTNQSLPMLVIRHEDKITVLLFYKYVSVMTLSLNHVPVDYRWDSANHYPLRGEMFSYRGDLRRIDFEVQLAAALADQGIQAIHDPKLETATAGFAQVEAPVVDGAGSGLDADLLDAVETPQPADELTVQTAPDTVTTPAE